MAQNNFFVSAFSPEGDKLFGAKVRAHGDNSILSAIGWVNDMGFEGKAETSSNLIGRSTPVVELKFSHVRLHIILEVDEKNQCPVCGYPKDEPNPSCDAEDGCRKFRTEEPEVVIDLDQAQAQLRAMFS